MASSTLKKHEKDHEKEKETLRQEHKVETNRLKAEKRAADIMAKKNENETYVRNGFDTKERLLRKEISELTEQVHNVLILFGSVLSLFVIPEKGH